MQYSKENWHKYFRLFAVITMALAGSYIAFRIYFDFSSGGSAWNQADWLINAHGGPVRRGPFGSGLIFISDISGIRLFDVLFIAQFGFFVLLFGSTAFVAMRLTKTFSYWLIFLSPGFFLIFWASDTGISTRKELIAYTAFALLLISFFARRAAPAVTVASVLVFLIAMWGNEANILLVPAYIGTLIITLTHHEFSHRTIFAGVLIVLLGALSAGLYAIFYAQVASSAAVCEPLTERGIDPNLCSGAISWLERSVSDDARLVAQKLNREDVYLAPLAYLLVVLPVIYLISLHNHARRLLLVFLLTGLAITPLFVIAADWGRWITM
ncbi:MAG: hypothetical protein ACC646_00795, partial [Paracoccaceae bacterium]